MTEDAMTQGAVTEGAMTKGATTEGAKIESAVAGTPAAATAAASAPAAEPLWAPDGWTLLRRQIADARCAFSLGVFGAIAEFMRDPDEPAALAAADDRLEIVTPRGAMRILFHDDARLLVYETPSRHAERRRTEMAACLPGAAARGRSCATLTEIGRDDDALRPEDRGALLFDLGLGTASLDAMIRTADPDLIAALRAAAGRPVFASGILAAIVKASPNRVFASRLGRIEVFGAIPAPDGRSPEGPHTHLLPQLLAHRRTHAATVPIPDGFVPCLGLHPGAAAHAGAAPAGGEGH